MSIDAIANPPKALESGRLFRVAYLPAYATVLFLLTLVWAGAPGSNISFSRAWATAAKLSAVQIALITIAVVLLATVLRPLQLPIVRVLEGQFPRWLGFGLPRRWQLWRKRKLEKKATLPSGKALDEAKIRAAGLAGTRLRQRFPLPEYLVKPTALGNALSAMEDSAGRVYGMDAVVAWPRLYPILGDRVKAVIDDRRDAMDGSAQMAASAAFASAASLGLLWRATDWWWLLALAPLAVAIVSYVGAVKAAIAYGEAVHAAFDLHRFDLLKALKVKIPSTQAEERTINRQLCDLWRQGVPPSLEYDSGKDER